jgi:hypothetical protein
MSIFRTQSLILDSPVNNQYNNFESNCSQTQEPPRQTEHIQYIPEPNPIPQYIEPIFQTQPNVTYVAPHNYNQPMIYQAHMATNPNGGTFMVLTPCIIQNPVVYSYRPVQNIVPINNNFIQIQPNQMQVINQPYIEQPYMIPTNFTDFRGVVTQNMSTNFNTINNNVYNNINKVGGDETIPTPLNNNNPMGFGDKGQEKNSLSNSKPDVIFQEEQGNKSSSMIEEEKK